MQDKHYKIFDGSHLRAYGLASRWQVAGKSLAGYRLAQDGLYSNSVYR